MTLTRATLTRADLYNISNLPKTHTDTSCLQLFSSCQSSLFFPYNLIHFTPDIFICFPFIHLLELLTFLFSTLSTLCPLFITVSRKIQLQHIHFLLTDFLKLTLQHGYLNMHPKKNTLTYTECNVRPYL